MKRIRSSKNLIIISSFILLYFNTYSQNNGPIKKLEKTLSGPPSLVNSYLSPGKKEWHEYYMWGPTGFWGLNIFPAPVDSKKAWNLVSYYPSQSGDVYVLASGWEISPDESLRSNPNWPEIVLKNKGIIPGKILGYIPEMRDRFNNLIKSPCSIFEAGENRFGVYSHAANSIFLFWYKDSIPFLNNSKIIDGDFGLRKYDPNSDNYGVEIPVGGYDSWRQRPETATLYSWESLIARTKKAILSCDCSPVIDELLPQAWGAPVPGALELVKKCDSVWLKRISTLSDSDSLEWILGSFRYRMRRDLHSNDYGYEHTPSTLSPSLSHYKPILEKALSRPNLTPTEKMLADVLLRIIKKESQENFKASWSDSFCESLPVITGLAENGVNENILIKPHPIFQINNYKYHSKLGRIAPENTDPKYSPWRKAKGKEIWKFTILSENTNCSNIYDGPELSVEYNYRENPAYVKNKEWEEKLQDLGNNIRVAEYNYGKCGYEVKYKSNTKIETYSTYSVVTYSNSWVESATWKCPEEVERANKAWENHLKSKPKNISQFNIESKFIKGRRRTHETVCELNFLLGTNEESFLLDGRIKQILNEYGEGANIESEVSNIDFPRRPVSKTNINSVPNNIKPFIGQWENKDFIIFINYENTKTYISIAKSKDIVWTQFLYNEGKDRENGFSFYYSFAYGGHVTTATIKKTGDSLEFYIPALHNYPAYTGYLIRSKNQTPYFQNCVINKASDFSGEPCSEQKQSLKAKLISGLIQENKTIEQIFKTRLSSYYQNTIDSKNKHHEIARTMFILTNEVNTNSPPSVRLINDWYNSQNHIHLKKPSEFWNTN